MPLDVIGSGFGRTGTTSLKLALEQLGLGPVHHMTDLFSVPGQVALWDRVVADPATVDWEAVFAGYRSAIDWPSSVYYVQLARAYPRAKVIHTERNAESWYKSMQATILNEATLPNLKAWPNRNVIEGAVLPLLGGLSRVRDRDHLIGVYQRWNAEVRRSIPPERLLVYDVAEGWEPLCRFLGVAVPEAPFPRVNTSEEFQRHLAPKLMA